MSDGEDYVTVQATIREVRKQSVLITVGNSVPRGDWIPRSLIHGADDRQLDGKFEGEKMSLRMFRWKAEQVGFVTAQDEETEDLFQRGQD